MAMLSFGGIDVSKDRLDVMVLPEEQSSSVSNDAAGWAELVEQLRSSSIAAIGIEASGGYERGVMRALLAADLPVRQVNPFKLRQFARASGVLAKSDPLDARMIASFVAIMPTRPAPRQAPAAERLTEMLAVRRQLSAEKVAAENASRLLEDQCCGVFLAVVLEGSALTSTCSTSTWSRLSAPMPRSRIDTNCLLPCPASAPCWPARCLRCCPSSAA